MSNAGSLVTAAVIAERCAKSSLFREGYDSYMQGKPFNYDIVDQSAYYERGRLFAIYTQQTKAPRAVWRQGVGRAGRGRVLRRAACWRKGVGRAVGRA